MVYSEFCRHTKGFCWAAPTMPVGGDLKLAPSLKGKRAYYYNDPKDPGNLLYCEECLRKMGVLW